VTAGLTLTIDLAALARNWKRLAAAVAPAECAAVVKADAYGIGAEHAVPALVAAGCRTFFVAWPEEGVRVRAVAPEAIVYVFGGFSSELFDLYRDADLRPVLNSAEELAGWMAREVGRPIALHIDTGMNRLGFPPGGRALLSRLESVGRANIALVISHLACADEPEHPKNASQLALFRDMLSSLPNVPASLANSSGILLGRDYHFDLVRPGIALYGGAPMPDGEIEAVVTAEARVLQLRDAAKGETVGYGATRTFEQPARLAILAAGYADGYLRAAGSAGAAVFINGRRAPIAGRVSMDLMAVDVTDVPNVRVGDRAELFGPNLPIGEVAAAAGTISYELLTGLSRRAERIYLDGAG
jgi:alanine racemase